MKAVAAAARTLGAYEARKQPVAKRRTADDDDDGGGGLASSSKTPRRDPEVTPDASNSTPTAAKPSKIPIPKPKIAQTPKSLKPVVPPKPMHLTPDDDAGPSESEPSQARQPKKKAAAKKSVKSKWVEDSEVDDELEEAETLEEWAESLTLTGREEREEIDLAGEDYVVPSSVASELDFAESFKALTLVEDIASNHVLKVS